MKNGRMWLLAGGLLSLGAVAIAWFLGASPLLAQASANEAQIAQIQSQNDAQMVEIAQMKQQFENIDELRDQLDELQLSVPGFPATASYFDEIAAKAGAAGVSLQTVTVEGAQPYGAMGSTESSEPTDGATDPAGVTTGSQGQIPAPLVPSAALAEDLYVLTVKFEIDADQNQLAAFLSALQGDGRLLLVTEVTSSFGTSQRSSITGYIFVVHDPRLGPIGALPTPTPTPDPAESAAPEEPAEPAASPTPTPTGTPTP